MNGYTANFHKKSTKTRRKDSGRISVTLVVVFAIVALGVFYLTQVNSLVSRGYKIRNYEEHFSVLEAENQELRIRASQLQSPAGLNEIVKNLNMVEAGQVSYLSDIEEGDMALKN